MLSFAPAARIMPLLVGLASMATAGSFCLFGEKNESWLPTVTSVSPVPVSPNSLTASALGTNTSSIAASTADARVKTLRISPPSSILAPGSGARDPSSEGVPLLVERTQR
jgi:hypothetical protein